MKVFIDIEELSGWKIKRKNVGDLESGVKLKEVISL